MWCDKCHFTKVRVEIAPNLVCEIESEGLTGKQVIEKVIEALKKEDYRMKCCRCSNFLKRREQYYGSSKKNNHKFSKKYRTKEKVGVLKEVEDRNVVK